MKLRKFNKNYNNFDPIIIIYRNIHKKHKTKISNFNIGKINSILFNYSLPNSTQIIRVLYKEMVILCDSKEYITKKYNINESTEKLKFLGYIYATNFKPPPNYLSLDKNILEIMFKFLTHKQELIDRNNYYMLQKENISKDINIHEDNFFNNLKNSSSIDKKSYKIENNNKNNNSRNKPIISNSKVKEKKIKKVAHFNSNETTKEQFNLKSYISSMDEESKFVSKNMETTDIKEKENEKINENSINSVMNLMENFKVKKKDNITKKYIKKKKDSIFNFKKNQKRYSSVRFLDRKNLKKTFTNQLIYNKNNILDLIKNYRKNINKINKYYLSIEKFKEKLKENLKIKKYLDNYWKNNKHFVRDLIDSKNYNNIISNNKRILNSISKSNFSSHFNFTSDASLSDNYYLNNIFSFSPISKLSLIPNSKKTLISNSRSAISFKNYKLDFLINKNNFINSVESKNSQNSLIMKIKNNSDFMKNKKFTCIYNKLNKNQIYDIKYNNCKILTFPLLKKIQKQNSINNKYNNKNSFNFLNKIYYYNRASSVSNGNLYIKNIL